MLFQKKNKPFSRLKFIACGFLLMIGIGTLFLMLPISARNGCMTDFMTALLTSTSASCVTGLIATDTASHWSIFGQIVILILIQVGGLGFISFGILLALLAGENIGLKYRSLVMDSINSFQIGGAIRLVKDTIKRAFIIEALGAVILTLRFLPIFGRKAIWYGIFHSISAFCNAGFDLMGLYSGEYSSFTAFENDAIVNITLSSLILLGGLGFVVWDDIAKKKWHIKSYRLHTKIVLLVSGILIAVGTASFMITDKQSFLQALFSAITPRTAGFNTVDTAGLSDAGKLMTMVLMFIGGGSGSTAGGVKMSTIFVLILYVKSNIAKDYGINIFERRVEDEAVSISAAVVTINMSLILLSSFLILAFHSLDMRDVLFETVSAISTVGMTTGITRDLNIVGQWVIIILMYLGRVGSLSFALAFTENINKAKISNPREKISVG